MKKTTYLIPLLTILSMTFLSQCSGENRRAAQNEQTVTEQLADKPGIVIDVRTPDEYRSGHLKIANFNYDLLSGEFEGKLSELDKDTTYYLYCRSGNRSGKAAELMRQHGFTDVHNLGGFQALVDKGLEAE